MQQNPRTRFATLTGVIVDAVERTRNRRIDVGVIEHDGWRLAAKLERDPLERLCRGGCHAFSGRRRTRKRDLVDSGMFDHPRADRSRRAGHDIKHAFGQAGFERDLTELYRSERRH